MAASGRSLNLTPSPARARSPYPAVDLTPARETLRAARAGLARLNADNRFFNTLAAVDHALAYGFAAPGLPGSAQQKHIVDRLHDCRLIFNYAATMEGNRAAGDLVATITAALRRLESF